MKYHNAYEGIRKIFTAQILSIISIGLLFLSSLLIILSLPGPVVSAVFSVGATVLSILALILELIGLKKASYDDGNFNTAFVIAIAMLIIACVNGLIGAVTVGTASDFANIFSTVLGFFIIFYIIEGIKALAGQLYNGEMVTRGKNIVTIFAAVYICSIVCNLVTVFVKNPAVIGIFGFISIGVLVAQLVAYILYLAYLSGAKTMLYCG